MSSRMCYLLPEILLSRIFLMAMYFLFVCHIAVENSDVSLNPFIYLFSFNLMKLSKFFLYLYFKFLMNRFHFFLILQFSVNNQRFYIDKMLKRSYR